MNIDVFSTYIAKWIIPKSKYTDDNIQAISYGVCALITSCLNLFLAGVVIGIFNLLETYLFFLICFVPIRCKHKGFHCKTLLRCLILTNILFTIATLLCVQMSFVHNSQFVFFIIVCLHYLASIEKNVEIHCILAAIYLMSIYFCLNIETYLIVSLILDFILIIGGRIDERKNEKISI